MTDRTDWPTRRIPLEQEGKDDYGRFTPAERVAMMWELAVTAWAFKGEPVGESRLPRHVVRVVRRER